MKTQKSDQGAATVDYMKLVHADTPREPKLTANHTPGPWFIQDNQIKAHHALSNGPGYLAPVAIIAQGWGDEVTIANKFLISASPELFIALERLCKITNRLGFMASPMEQELEAEVLGALFAARAALAKAKGTA